MQLECFLERDRVAPEQPATLAWLVRATGAGPGLRVPLNLALVIDVSGSMAGAKLDRVKESAAWIVERLGPEDSVSVVSFATDVRVDVPATAVGDAWRPPILNAIARLTPGGGTNLSGGWSEGVFQVQRRHRPGSANRVLLLTDGAANQGVTDPAKLRAVTRQAAVGDSLPVSTSVVGVGDHFQEHLLLGLAQEGGGAFHYVTQAAEIGDCLRAELDCASQLAAQNVTLELKPAPWVRELKQLTDHPATWDAVGRVFTLRLGDVSQGARRQAGLGLVIDPGVTASELPLLAGSARWLDLSGDTPRRVDQTVRAAVEVAAGPATGAADVQHELAVMRLGRARRMALRHADAGSVSAALDLLALARVSAECSLVGADARAQDHLRSLARLERTLRDDPVSLLPGTRTRKQALTETYHAGSATVRLRP